MGNGDTSSDIFELKVKNASHGEDTDNGISVDSLSNVNELNEASDSQLVADETLSVRLLLASTGIDYHRPPLFNKQAIYLQRKILKCFPNQKILISFMVLLQILFFGLLLALMWFDNFAAMGAYRVNPYNVSSPVTPLHKPKYAIHWLYFTPQLIPDSQLYRCQADSGFRYATAQLTTDKYEVHYM
eukprot:Awhi_evm1s15082